MIDSVVDSANLKWTVLRDSGRFKRMRLDRCDVGSFSLHRFAENLQPNIPIREKSALTAKTGIFQNKIGRAPKKPKTIII